MESKKFIYTIETELVTEIINLTEQNIKDRVGIYLK